MGGDLVDDQIGFEEISATLRPEPCGHTHEGEASAEAGVQGRKQYTNDLDGLAPGGYVLLVQEASGFVHQGVLGGRRADVHPEPGRNRTVRGIGRRGRGVVRIKDGAGQHQPGRPFELLLRELSRVEQRLRIHDVFSACLT